MELKRDDSIKLGDRVSDAFSGVTGYVLAIQDWIGGTRLITVAPDAPVEGRLAPIEEFHAERLRKMSDNCEYVEQLGHDNFCG